jgi:hypothetical protein
MGTWVPGHAPVGKKDTYMAPTYHVTFADRMAGALSRTLLRAGVKLGTISLLTVRGRKSGKPQTVLVLLVEQEASAFSSLLTG